MNLKRAILTVLTSVVMCGDQQPNPENSTTHIKCIRGKKLQLPVKKITKQLPVKKITKPAEKHAGNPGKHEIKHQGNPVRKYAKPVEKYSKPDLKHAKPAKGPKKILNQSRKKFELECLNRHNEHRRKLRTKEGPIQELKWSDELAKKAQEWGNQLVKENSDRGISLRHSTEMNWGYGENLYSSKGGNQSCTTNGCCIGATDAWFNEWPIYKDEEIPGGKFKEYGHYTQLAWPNTRSLGCACVNNGDSIRFVVCEYDPPGNMMGQKLGVFFKQNAQNI